MPNKYEKHYFSEEEYSILEKRDDGRPDRIVQEDQIGYLEWLADGNIAEVFPYTYVPEVVTLEELRDRKIKEIADARYAEETKSVQLENGAVVNTDRESQALLTGASLASLFKFLGPNLPPEMAPLLATLPDEIDWKCAEGWEKVTDAQVIYSALMVRGHVQACFSKEKLLNEMVNQAYQSGDADAIKRISWNMELA